MSEPTKSVTLRKFHRFKKRDINHPENTKPDFQEILTGIEFIVWINTGEDKAQPSLCDRISQAFANPSSVTRFGTLCLGESRDLVNQIDLLPENYQAQCLQWLIRDEYGYLSLPYWVDYVGSKNTRWLRYSLETMKQDRPSESSWTIIQPI